MPGNPEEEAREEIDRLLIAAGWSVQDYKSVDLHAAQGVALREFPLKDGYGEADYLLYVDAKAAGVIEAKRVGATLTGVEVQSGKYSKGLPDALPAWRRPLPFLYESTGLETHFTNGLDPEPRARNVFAFHRPETLAAWLSTPQPDPASVPAKTARYARSDAGIGTFASRTALPRIRRAVREILGRCHRQRLVRCSSRHMYSGALPRLFGVPERDRSLTVASWPDRAACGRYTLAIYGGAWPSTSCSIFASVLTKFRARSACSGCARCG